MVQIRGNHAEHRLDHNLALRAVRTVRDALAPETRAAFEEGLPAAVREALNNRVALSDNVADPNLTQALVTAMSELVTHRTTGAVLLSIDNLHWLDRGSLHWLALLRERLSSLPILVVGSVCEGLQGTDCDLLEELLFETTQLARLRPLDEAAVGAVLATAMHTDPEPAFTAAALRVTAGNPLLLATLTELMADLGIAPDASSVPLLDELAVDSVASSVRVRTRRISPDAFAVYRIVAALDGDATVDNVAYLSGIDAAIVDADCHAMRKMGLLTDDHSTLRAAQPLVRRSVLRECPPALFQDVHAQAAELLQCKGAQATAIARHLLIVRQPVSKPWAVTALLTAACDARALNDPGAAIRYLRRALIEPLPSEMLALVLTGLTGALTLVDIADADTHLAKALAASPTEVARRMAPQPFVLLALGDRLQQMRAVHQHTGVDRRPALAPSMRLLRHMASGPNHPPEESAAEAANDTLSIGLRAWEDTMTMRVSAAAATELALRVTGVPVPGADDLVGQTFGLRVLTATGELTRGLRLCQSVETQAHGQGIVPVEAIAVHVRSILYRRMGMRSTARADAEESLRLVNSWDPEGTSALWQLLHAYAVHLHTEESAIDLAWSLVDRINRVRKGSEEAVSLVLHATGRLRMKTGDLTGALRDFVTCGAILKDRGTVNPAVLPWRLEVATALDRLGQTKAAREHVTEHLEQASAWGAPVAVAAGLRVRALISEPSESAAALEEAVELLRPTEDRVALVKALLERGRQLRAARDPVPARQILREAHDVALQLDSPVLMDGIRRELQAAGGRVPRSRRQGADGLTESERRVAELAAQGKKNREIAQTLFVQVRTVEIHLTNTYRKLGIGGRDDLAGALGHRAVGLAVSQV